MSLLPLVLPRGLVVSCQAPAGHPLRDPAIMAAMARAADRAGAVAIRANGTADIAAIRAVTGLPIIGIDKRVDPRSPVIITPDLEAARGVVEAGADLVALDATFRTRPDGGTAAALIALVKAELRADIATFEEGTAAAAAGADYVATTLSGYTGPEPPPDGPDLALLATLARELDVPVVGEGRFAHPDQLRTAFEQGAHAVVIGTAITDPLAIARRFAGAVPAR